MEQEQDEMYVEMEREVEPNQDLEAVEVFLQEECHGDGWEEEKQEMLVSMFPLLCPDWLLEQVQACGAQVESEDGQARDRRLEERVEQVFSLSSEELADIPTRLEWEARKKERLVCL